MAGLFQRSSLSTMITRALVVVLLLTSFSCSLVVATSTGTTTSETQKSAIETTTDVTTMQEGSVSNTRTTDDGTTSSDGRTTHSDGGTTTYMSTTNSATTNKPSTQTSTTSQTTVVTAVTGGSETLYSATTSMTSPTTIEPATSSSSHTQASVTSSTTNTMNPANDNTSAVSTSQDDKGSAAVAGLCLAGVIILIIAINAFVFFRSKLGACTSQSGVFHVLQMSAIKKNRSNHTDVDVEARVEEDADVGDKTGSSTSLTKDSTSPVDQAPELNGDVKVTVHDMDIEISSTAIDDGSGESKTLVENEDSKDVNPATVDSKESVEIVVPVTVEGSIENQNEEPSSK